jgi:hypothetical protein
MSRLKLRSQPRIPGVKRQPTSTALHPAVVSGLRAIARREGKSLSWVRAEIVSIFFGVDAATGEIHKKGR